MSSIVFYVSGHGFGHASRAIEVINALLGKRPDQRVIVRTAAPRWLFDLTIRGRAAFSSLETDTGVVQVDSLNLDEAESIRRAWSFYQELPTRASAEARFLREQQASVVVGDIPPLAFSAAYEAGVPSIAIGNFTWDWIYADYPRVRLAPHLLPTIRAAYAKAGLALRLPMHGGFEAFKQVQDIPFIARHATKTREEVLKTLKLPGDKPIVLVSFGGYGVDGLDVEELARIKKYTVVFTSNVPVGGRGGATPPPSGSRVHVVDEYRMHQSGVRYEDLVGAADAVATKPGYGIIAECLANKTALLYTSRGHFIEYDVLVEQMPTCLRCAFISHADLFAGKWETHLDRLLAQKPPKEKPATDGADVAAELIIQALDMPRRGRRAKGAAAVKAKPKP